MAQCPFKPGQNGAAKPREHGGAKQRTPIESVSIQAQSNKIGRVNVLAAHVAAGLGQPYQEHDEHLLRDVSNALTKEQLIGLKDLPGPRSTNTRAFNAGVHRYLCQLHEKFGDIFKIVHQGKELVVVRDQKRVNTLLTSDVFGKTGWMSAELSTDKVNYVMNLIQPMLAAKTPFHNTQSQGNGDLMSTELRRFFRHAEGFTAQWEALAISFFEATPPGDYDVQSLCFRLFERLVMLIMAGDKVEQACEAAGPAFRHAFEYFVQRYTEGGASYAVSPADEIAMDRLHDAAKRAAAVVLCGEEGKTPSLLWEMKHRGHHEDTIVATMVNCMVAAVETPASAMARTLQELAFNRGLQEDMRHAAGEHLEDMTMEALRRFAPATLLLREALEDVALGDVLLPKGTTVGICVPAVHGCPQHFSQPATFISDRDLSFNPQSMFLTFSGGQRGCLGKYFALEMMQVALSQITKRFQLRPLEDYSKRSDFPKFMEWSTEGIHLKLSVRN